MDITANVSGLFPTPLVETSLGRNVTDAERNFINSLENNKNDNLFNYVSKNSYVLEDSILSDMKRRIESALKFYVDNIICPNDGIDFFITQSWITWTHPGGRHFSHIHTNSVISGVLYIDVDPTTDNITFSKSNDDIFDFKPKNHNPFNSDDWFIPVENNKIILFPSSLKHSVRPTTNPNTRISLGFNTFVSGLLGADGNLNQLRL